MVELQIYEYQEELLQLAIEKNCTAFLPTGAGKTLIACRLIDNRLSSLRNSNRKKVIAFIAPTKILVSQQAAYIRTHCSTPDIKVALLTGEMKFQGKSIDRWDTFEWQQNFEYFDVFAIVPELMRNVLQKNYLRVENFEQFIFDECHNVTKNNPMGIVCDIIRDSGVSVKIFGMTASPIAAKKGSVKALMKELSDRLMGEIFLPSNMKSIASLQSSVQKPSMILMFYDELITNEALLSDDFVYRTTSIAEIFSYSVKRVRVAYLIDNIYKILNTLQKPAEYFPALELLRLPRIDLMDNSSEQVIFHDKLHNVQESLQSVTTVVADCGVYCGINAFINVLQSFTDKSISNQMYKVSRPTGEASVVSTIDISEFERLANDIQKCRWNYRMCLDQTTTCCSAIFLMFVGLASSISPKYCRAAADKIRGNFANLSSLYNSSTIFGSMEESYDFDREQVSNILDGQIDMNLLGRLINVLEILASLEGFSFISVAEEANGVVSLLYYEEEITSIDVSNLSVNTISVSMIAVLCVLLEIIDLKPIVQLFETPLENNDVVPLENVYRLGHMHIDKVYDIGDIGEALEQIILQDIYLQQIHDNCCRSNSLPLFSYKTLALIYICTDLMRKIPHLQLLTATADELASVGTIVFCTLKLTTLALAELFKIIQRYSENMYRMNGIEGKLFPFRAEAIVGGTNRLSQQNLVLEKLKTGKINYLFSTSVAEEGIDISTCKIVVNFDPPATVKSLIQRRGRARQKNSIMLSLVPNTEKCKKYLTDLIDFNRQELHMMNNAQKANNNSVSSSKNEYYHSIFSNKSFGYGSQSQDFDQFGLRDMVINKTTYSSPFTEAVDSFFASNQDSTFETSAPMVLMNYHVSRSGAKIFATEAIQLICRYCQSISQDKYIDAVATYDIEHVTGRFRCSILLPVGAPPSARCVVGNICSNKKEAKADVALQCVIKLYELNEIDEQFRVAAKILPAIIPETSETNLPLAEDVENSAMVNVLVKTVPDVLVDCNLSGNNTSVFVDRKNGYSMDATVLPSAHYSIFQRDIVLHFYAIKVAADDDDSYHRYMGCMDCSAYVQAMNYSGLAVLKKLPDDMVKTITPLYLRDAPGLSMQMEYLGVQTIAKCDLINMQRYHRAVCVIEDDALRFLPEQLHHQVLDPVNFHFDDPIVNVEDKLINHEDWCCSSAGAWYVAYPIPTVPFYGERELSFPAPIPVIDIFCFKDYERFSKSLRQFADEAQILIHNLRVNHTASHNQIVCTDYEQSSEYFEKNQFGIPPSSSDLDMMFANSYKNMFRLLRIGNNEGVHINHVAQKRKINVFLKETTYESSSRCNLVCSICNESLNSIISSDISDKMGAFPADDIMGSSNEANTLGESEVDIELSNSPVDSGQCEPQSPKEIEDSGNKKKKKTYYENYLMKNIAEEYISKLASNPNYRMSTVSQLSSKMTLTGLLLSPRQLFVNSNKFVESEGVVVKKKETTTDDTTDGPIHNHKNVSYIALELHRRIGKAKWYYVSLVIPSLIFRIQSLLLAEEARSFISKLQSGYEIQRSSTAGSSIVMKNSRDNSSRASSKKEDSFQHKPSLLVMLEALSPKLAGEVQNYERLELLGDAFFKYVITVEIFKIHKRHREGQLSGIRASLVNNFHFKSVAIESKLVQYLRAIPISIGVEKCLWMPAGATFASYENGIIMDLRNENINYDISSDRTEFHISQATYLKQLRDHSMLKDGILNNEILGNKIQQNHNMELENHSGVTSGVATPRQVDSLANVDSIERNFMLSTAVRNLAIASTDPENLSVEIDADYDASTAGAPTSKHCLEGKEIVKEIDWQSMRFSVAEVKYKTVADLVESVVGAYFLCGGEESAIQVIKALGGWPRAVSHESSEEVEVTKESYCEEKTYRTASNVNNFYSEVNDDEEGAIVFPLGYSKNLSDLVLFGKSMSTFDSAKRKAENMSDSNNDRSSPVQQSSKYYEADSPSASGYYDPNDMVFDVGSNGKNDNLSLMSIQIAESCTSFGGIDSLNDSIAKKLGYKFADINLLRQAVTHSTPNHAIGKTYQRLEFLGDAVLDFVVVYALFQNKSNLQQGDVSLLKSRFTNNKHLAQLSLKFNLHHYILTSSPQLCEELRLVSHWTSSSKLIDQQKLNLPVFKIIADVFEAIIGAIYLDCGSSLQIMMDLVRRIELVEEIL